MTRSVAESPEYGEAKEKLLKELGQSAAIFDDEFCPGFDFVLACKPNLYAEVIKDSGVRWFATRAGVLPPLSIWYRAEETRIVLLYIEVYSNGHDDD